MPQTKKTPVAIAGYGKMQAVIPSDSVNFTGFRTQGLFVGATGNLAIVLPDDGVYNMTAVPAGSFVPVAAKRVNVTGTTATGIIRMG